MGKIMKNSELERIIFDKLTGRLPLASEKEKSKTVSLADEIHALATAGQIMDPLDFPETANGCIRNIAVQQRMLHELSCSILLELLYRLEDVEKQISMMDAGRERLDR